MKTKLFTLAAIIAATLCTPAFAADNKEATFSVNGNCSGTLIDAKGLILTAAHCVDTMYEDVERDVVDKDNKVKKETVRIPRPGFVQKIKTVNGSEVSRKVWKFRVEKQDRILDLALVQTAEALDNIPPASLACVTPPERTPVYTLGNPFGVLYQSYAEGVIAATRSAGDLGLTEGGDNMFIQSTSPIAPGSSGGGLYEKSSEKLIGVTTRGYIPFVGFNLSVPVEDIRKFIGKTCD